MRITTQSRVVGTGVVAGAIGGISLLALGMMEVGGQMVPSRSRFLPHSHPHAQDPTGVMPVARKGGMATPAHIRQLLKQKKTADAVKAYDRYSQELGRDDDRLLKEVALAVILPLGKDMRDQMRGASYSALKEWRSEETVPYVEEGLGDGSGLVRALAAEGLGSLEAGRQSTRFRQALSDKAALVRVNVLKGLGRTGNLTHMSLIEPALKDDQGMVRVAALGALFTLGQTQRFGELLESARAKDRYERRSALRLLGKLGDPRGMAVLQEAANDPQPTIRASAAAGLGALGHQDALPFLVELLSDTIAAVRSVAALSLGHIDLPKSIAVLRKSLHDDNAGVRAASVAALLELGTPLTQVDHAVRPLAQDKNPAFLLQLQSCS